MFSEGTLLELCVVFRNVGVGKVFPFCISSEKRCILYSVHEDMYDLGTVLDLLKLFVGAPYEARGSEESYFVVIGRCISTKLH